MIAVVLVGGEGTRLRPLTLDRPKPMLPIANRPFLAHLLDRVAEAGVTEVIFSCGYLPDAISETFGDAYRDMRLTYIVEPEPLDTAGAIRFAAFGRVGSETFLALNGDILAAARLRDLLDQHRRRGAQATLTLTAVDDPRRYGLVLAEPDGAVSAFLEKPGDDGPALGAGPHWINAGIYALEPAVLDRIEPGRRVNIERVVFPALIGNGLEAWRAPGYWNDIGTPTSYIAANLAVVAGALGGEAATSLVDPTATIAPTAIVDGGSVIGAGVTVGARAHVSGSVVHEGATVEDGAVVLASAIGRGARVGAVARVRNGAVLGSGVRVPAGAVVDGERLPEGGAP
jgi:mannose-1-phosphate guanylyltransferase